MKILNLADIIQRAKELGASDVHMEAGLPMAFRIRGGLKVDKGPVPAQLLREMARSLLTDIHWSEFIDRRSYDLARTIQGVRCRINLLHSTRGIGFAIRLLSNFRPTIAKLNLHPDLVHLVTKHEHGLILVSGATGSGKTSTLAALLNEINTVDSRHIVTLESPIEYMITPQRSFIRQREVGRDTPSFEQGLYDAMREDPDVLMVGEMRDPETIRLTLNAAETGHLVLATLHSSNSAEALSRVVSAFPAEIQASIAAQLADCLLGVICQRLVYRQDLHINVPECEILVSSLGAKSVIRKSDFSKLQTVLQTGAQEGSFSFERYREWLNKGNNFYVPRPEDYERADEHIEPTHETSRTIKPSGRADSQEGFFEIPDDDVEISSLISQIEKHKPKE